MRRTTLLPVILAVALLLIAECGTNTPSRGGNGATEAVSQQPEDSDAEAGIQPLDDADAEEGTTLLADILAQTKLAPDGKAAVLVADAEQVPGVLLELALNPCSAPPALQGLIDRVYMSEWAFDVDFIMFVIDPSVHALAPFGITDESVTHYQPIRYLDRGVGTDDSQDRSVGPPGLRGYILLGEREEIVSGVALHELGHAWAADLTGPPALANQIIPPDADLDDCDQFDRRIHHWNNAHVNGMMGGWSDLAGVCDDSEDYPPWYVYYQRAFAPLELYLMGLVEPEEVPPVEIYPEGFDAAYRFVEDPEDSYHGGYDELFCIDDTGRDVSQEEFEAQIITVTVEEIIEHNGPRVPTVADSPKHFRIALLVFAAQTLEYADWDFYHRAIGFLAAPEDRSVRDSFPADLYPDLHADLVAAEDWYGALDSYPFQNFYTATGGRATIEFIDLQTDKTAGRRVSR